MQIILQSLLTLHLIGLIIMAGTTVVSYITMRTFWKLFDKEEAASLYLLQATSKYPMLIGIGSIVIIITGIGMMASTHGVFGEQLWFRIKFALVIVLILNGILVGSRQGIKLRKIMSVKDLDSDLQINSVRINLKRFYLVQLAVFFVIIFLSVFKFN